MAKDKPPQEKLTAIRTRRDDLPHGVQGAYIQLKAKQLEIHESTLYRWLDLKNRTKRLRQLKNPEYRTWVRVIKFVQAREFKKTDTKLTIRKARQHAVDEGMLPIEALNVPVETLHRIVRELGYPKNSHVTLKLMELRKGRRMR